MKRSNFAIIILIVAVIVSIVLYFTNQNSTLKKELRDFAVEDTSTVDKIFMVNKANQSVLLERKNGGWFVNEKFPARKDAIYILLKTICRVEVKMPVAKTAFDNIVKMLAAQSTKVEIYQNGALLKTYYVGGPTQDQYGTYMMIENSSVPFIVHIPGFSGYLTTRYFIEENLWRAPAIFSYQYANIKEIQVENYSNPEQSFRIEKKEDNTIQLFSLKSKTPVENCSEQALKEYTSLFKIINYESVADNIRPTKRDSVLAKGPSFKISVKDNSGKASTITTYRRPGDGLINEEGSPYEFDPDRMYGILDNGEMVILQYYVFDPLLRNLSDFSTKP